MSEFEFPRPIDMRSIRNEPMRIEADEAERTALARRFDLVSIARLEATVTFEVDGAEIAAAGTLEADVVQSCAVSGDDLAVAIREPLAFRFVPETGVEEEEVDRKSVV